MSNNYFIFVSVFLSGCLKNFDQNLNMVKGKEENKAKNVDTTVSQTFSVVSARDLSYQIEVYREEFFQNKKAVESVIKVGLEPYEGQNFFHRVSGLNLDLDSVKTVLKSIKRKRGREWYSDFVKKVLSEKDYSKMNVLQIALISDDAPLSEYFLDLLKKIADPDLGVRCFDKDSQGLDTNFFACVFNREKLNDFLEFYLSLEKTTEKTVEGLTKQILKMKCERGYNYLTWSLDRIRGFRYNSALMEKPFSLENIFKKQEIETDGVVQLLETISNPEIYRCYFLQPDDRQRALKSLSELTSNEKVIEKFFYYVFKKKIEENKLPEEEAFNITLYNILWNVLDLAVSNENWIFIDRVFTEISDLLQEEDTDRIEKTVLHSFIRKIVDTKIDKKAKMIERIRNTNRGIYAVLRKINKNIMFSNELDILDKSETPCVSLSTKGKNIEEKLEKSVLPILKKANYEKKSKAYFSLSFKANQNETRLDGIKMNSSPVEVTKGKNSPSLVKVHPQNRKINALALPPSLGGTGVGIDAIQKDRVKEKVRSASTGTGEERKNKKSILNVVALQEFSRSCENLVSSVHKLSNLSSSLAPLAGKADKKRFGNEATKSAFNSFSERLYDKTYAQMVGPVSFSDTSDKSDNGSEDTQQTAGKTNKKRFGNEATKSKFNSFNERLYDKTYAQMVGPVSFSDPSDKSDSGSEDAQQEQTDSKKIIRKRSNSSSDKFRVNFPPLGIRNSLENQYSTDNPSFSDKEVSGTSTPVY